MDTLPWQFPAVLFAALVLTAVMSVLQVRRYNAELRDALASSTGANDVLLSGRHRSFRGGAIVVLVADRKERRIVRARAMAGFTVLARFRDRPELEGPLDDAADRARNRAVRMAVQHALQQMPHEPSAEAKRRAAARRARADAIRASHANRATPTHQRSTA